MRNWPNATPSAVRVAAIKEMFARGFGRATQPIEGSVTYGGSEQLAELFRENANGTLGTEIALRAALPPNAKQLHWQGSARLDKSSLRFAAGVPK